MVIHKYYFEGKHLHFDSTVLVSLMSTILAFTRTKVQYKIELLLSVSESWKKHL